MMNDRIKKLAKQAELYALDKQNEGDYDYFFDGFQEKFAELIVWECIEIVQPESYDGDAMTASLNAKVKQIKQRFGVE